MKKYAEKFAGLCSFIYFCTPNNEKICMTKKANRLETLRRVISSQELGSQQELLRALKRLGYSLTQATLSRDLKHIKAVKAAAPSGRYIYVLPTETTYRYVPSASRSYEQVQLAGFRSIEFSGNMAVVKTQPGYAASVAYNIDNTPMPEILGTIAGDDTVFITLREGASREKVARMFQSLG